MNFNVKLTGFEEIDKVLKGLPSQLNHRVLQNAHAAAAKPLVQKEKLLAPEGPTGHLVDSIGVTKTSIARANSLGEINVGPRRGRYGGAVAHLVEFGTVTRATERGANRGKMTANPFAMKAWDVTKNIVLTAINTEIGRKLYSFMKRTIKNAQ